ncbi:MAG TPA: ubiquinone biosynthesis protein UbiA [Anaerolineae bacterium]|nr:ubiquinone biosynthesis protein UbiA [Anaerolineae bacterium]
MNRFFALSRTSHGILDLATPAFVALLWLGAFPDWTVTALSIFTAFAGYTAIYALNDLVGIAVDKEKFSVSGINEGYSVEASEMRYPLARNILPYNKGLAWMLTWFILALIGSYLLNPVIVFILTGAAILEIVYVKLLKVTYLRTFVSGLVKASGPIAAVFVVDPNPSPASLLILLVWLFFWEIGGQNVPADWNDTAEDKQVNAKTIPIHFGVEMAGIIVIVALAVTVITSVFLPSISPINLGIPFISLSLVIGYVFLLQPGYQLSKNRGGRDAAKLFDRASFYPVAQFLLISVFVIYNTFIN